jgi:2-polyprenyl-6-methoxyphenol hydroxylase-like FAD-dependent oxidoreductase
MPNIRWQNRLLPYGSRLERAQRVDATGHIMQERSLAGQARVHVFVRQMLIEVLRDAAQKEGAEVVTGSMAVGADPAGELRLANGNRLRADLVIVADGARSLVRDSLDIGASYQALATLVNRYLLPSRDLPLGPIMKEHWSGRYRIGTAPCGNHLSYVYQVYPEWDKAASALPSSVAVWSKAFPRLRTEIELLSQASAIQHRYSVVRCLRWSTGRVAVTGDAAHGLPPALGQGVGHWQTRSRLSRRHGCLRSRRHPDLRNVGRRRSYEKKAGANANAQSKPDPPAA